MTVQGGSAEPASLESILISPQLEQRVSRATNRAAEDAALLAIAMELESAPNEILRQLCNAALTLCRADCSGISILEEQRGAAAVFRWTVLTGSFAPYVDGTTPRDFSPCGVCLDANAPVLFAYPERRFTYLGVAGLPLAEGLVLPFSIGGRAIATIWIITHDETRQFDREDVRVMQQLAGFASIAYDAAARAARFSA